MSVYYAQINLNTSKVIGMSALSGQVDYPYMVEISKEVYEKKSLLGTTYRDGKFVGKKFILNVDKEGILADGKDCARIQMTVFDCVEAKNDTLYSGIVTFSLNSQYELVENIVNGMAEITLCVEEKGKYEIRTANKSDLIIEDGYVVVIAR